MSLTELSGWTAHNLALTLFNRPKSWADRGYISWPAKLARPGLYFGVGWGYGLIAQIRMTSSMKQPVYHVFVVKPQLRHVRKDSYNITALFQVDERLLTFQVQL